MALTERNQFALDSLTPEERDEWERYTAALVERVDVELLPVLERYGPPDLLRQCRWVAVNCVAALTARLRHLLAQEHMRDHPPARGAVLSMLRTLVECVEGPTATKP